MIKKLISLSLFTTTLLLGGFFLGNTPRTMAAEEAKAQVFCGFNEKLTELVKVQNDKEVDSLQKIKNELVVRKELLALVIDCSVKEAELLKTKLGAAKVKDKEMAEAQKKTLAEIDEAIKYYKNQTPGIKDLGIQGSKLLAKKILDWRSSNYSILVGRTVNIISWSNAEDFLVVADQRFLDVSVGVSGIREESEGVGKVLDEAKESLENARVLIASSKKSILEYAPNSTAIESIKKSLENLALAYKSFFEMGQVIKDETLKKIE